MFLLTEEGTCFIAGVFLILQLDLSHESTPFGKFETQDAPESHQNARVGFRGVEG